MKRTFLCLAFLSCVIIFFGQAPQAFNYQAILRNADGIIITNETVTLQVSIIDSAGASVYTEMHDTQTNESGLVNVVIGQGTTSNDISLIDWANGPYFLDIAVNEVNIGSSPLFSVPYALHAKTVETYTETQNLSAVLAVNNDAGTSQIKNIANPTEEQYLPLDIVQDWF